MNATVSIRKATVNGGRFIDRKAAKGCCYLPFSCLWLFIIVPKTVAAALYAVLLVWMFASRKHVKQPSEQLKNLLVLLVIASAVYLVSIIRAMFVEFDADRLIAAFGTLLSWLLAMGYIAYYSTCRYVSWLAISKRAALSVFILAAALLLFHAAGSSFPRILGRAVSSADYLSSGVTPRFTAFMEFPTLVAMLTLVMYGPALYWFYRKWGFLGAVVLSIISILTITAASSRAGIFAMIALIAASFVCIAYSRSQKVRHYFLPLGILAALAMVLVFVVYGSVIAHAALDVINSRSGSTGGRLYLYSESLSSTLSNSPIIGMGVKYTSSLSNDAPFGSHSTWIGFFYKTGFVGLILYGILFFRMFRMQWSRATKENVYEIILAINLLILYTYLFVEDLDSTAWVCVLFFSLFAARMNCKEAEGCETGNE